MWVLHTSPKVVFILHPKTATRAIEQALRRLPVQTEVLRGRHGIHNAIMDRCQKEGAIIAGTVRNPFSLFESWWSYTNRGKEGLPDFKEWLPKFINGKVGGARSYVQPGKPLFYGYPYMNRTIKYEGGPEKGVNKVLREVGLEPVTLTRVGSEGDRRPKDTYLWTPELCLMVHDLFIDDFRHFGYNSV